MGVSIEFKGRLEQLLLPNTDTLEIANNMNLALAKGQRFLIFRHPDPTEENPIVFNMDQILVVHPTDEHAIGAGF